MASLVQTVASNTVSGTSKAFTLSSTSGSIIIEIAVRGNSNAPASFTITDNMANTYTQRQFLRDTGDQRVAAIYDCIGATAGVTSITVAPDTLTTRMMGCIAIQEVNGITAIDQSAQGTYSTSPLTLTTGVVDTGNADFVAAAISVGSNKTAQGISDPPSGYISAAANQNDNGTSSGSGECCYRFNTSAVTDSVTWAVTGGGLAGDPAVIASYHSTSGGGGGGTRSRLTLMGAGA